MTKDVLISITGMHTDAIDKGDLTDGPIEVITPASYFCKNGKHYILYEEVAEGIPGAVSYTHLDVYKRQVYGDIIYPMIHEEEKKTIVKLCDEGGRLFAAVEFTGEQ